MPIYVQKIEWQLSWLIHMIDFPFGTDLVAPSPTDTLFEHCSTTIHKI